MQGGAGNVHARAGRTYDGGLVVLLRRGHEDVLLLRGDVAPPLKRAQDGEAAVAHGVLQCQRHLVTPSVGVHTGVIQENFHHCHVLAVACVSQCSDIDGRLQSSRRLRLR